MEIAIYLIIGVIAGIVVWQLYIWITENQFKNKQCRAALNYCREKGKMLLVAGGPWGGRKFRLMLHRPAHIPGDVCIDIRASALVGHPNGIVANVMNLPFRDKTFGAVLASHLLEHLNTIEEAEKALDEMSRVADAVIIVYPYRQSLIAWLLPDHHLWIQQKNNQIYIFQRRNNNKQKQVDRYELNCITFK